MVAVQIEHLKKHFSVPQREAGLLGVVHSFFQPKKKIVRAVDYISFTIDEGELVGFIGPNGAGKTTTLKILSGVLYPTAGMVRVAGHIPWRREEEFLKKITLVMGQKNQLLWELPAMDSFLLNRAIYEIPKVEFKQTLEELVSLLEVEQLLTTPVRKLSLGQRMRLELVATLLHRPRILFLDEPTIGLDVVAAQNIREFITAYNKKTGATVLLTSHYMGDIAQLASRVCIINEGKLIFEGSLAKIVDRWVNEKVIRVLLTNEPNMQELSEIGEVISYQFPRVEIRIPRAAAPGAAARLLQKFSVADLTIEEPPIEEVIRKIFTNSKR